MKDEDRKIIESAENIKRKFRTEIETDVDRVDMSFLDYVNAHIKSILGDDGTDVYTALTPGQLGKWKKRYRWTRWLRNFSLQRAFYFILLALITVFLLIEALNFYAVGGIISLYTYFKAALTEVSFIFLNGYRASENWLHRALVGALRVALFSLMLFVISSAVLFDGANTRSDISNLATQIATIEQQIKDKQKEIDYYISIQWPKNVTIARNAKDKLVERLLALKEQQMLEKKNENVSDLVLYQTWGRALFRVILLLISALLTRRLFKF